MSLLFLPRNLLLRYSEHTTIYYKIYLQKETNITLGYIVETERVSDTFYTFYRSV